MICSGFTFLSIYVVLIFYIIYLIKKLPKIKENFYLPKNKFSIIIPFKNEADNLYPLLNSLEKIKYPKDFFEIIFINDHSTDEGEKIIESFQTKIPVKILQNTQKSKSPKKDALEIGIKKARYDYIITTDADCIIPKNWLLSYNHFIVQKKPELIAGPVIYADKSGFINKFQSLEFLILQAFTQAGFAIQNPFLANGANLCFTKNSFEQVGGYQGNKHLASGDDIFLLEKIRKKFPKKIYFLKDANNTVKTFPLNNLQQLIHQKIRWASKMKTQKFSLGFFVGLLILIINIYLIVFVFYPSFFIYFFLIKFLTDAYFIKQINTFYQNKINYSDIFLSVLIYPYYLFLIFLGIINGKFQWKGNKY